MRYHGAQPRDGDAPSDLFRYAEAAARGVVESMFVSTPEKLDDLWVRLGALQIHLEHGLSISTRVIGTAVMDCERLEQADYHSEWKKRVAVRSGLEHVYSALVELLGDGEGDDRSLLADLGRETLVPKLVIEELRRLWKPQTW